MLAASLTTQPPSSDWVLRGDRYRFIRELSTAPVSRSASHLAYQYTQVYLAEDLLQNDLVVLKQPNMNLPAKEAALAQQFYFREHTILGIYKHPRISHLRNSFVDQDGTPFMVLDYIEGQTLEELLVRGGGYAPVALALYIGIQLCEVLAFLHEQMPPIIHRDIKPSNVLLTDSGYVYLIDFGIAHCKLARQIDRQRVPRHLHESTAGPSSITNLGIGTYGHAAPEQYDKNGPVTPQTGLYGLGVLLHQMLSGEDPRGKPASSLFTFPALRQPELVLVNTLVVRLLKRNPHLRPQNASQVQTILEQAIHSPIVHSASHVYQNPTGWHLLTAFDLFCQ